MTWTTIVAPKSGGGGTALGRPPQIGGASNGGGSAVPSSAPQLGGLFAGGMPKLKSRSGGLDTGGKKQGALCLFFLV